MNRTLVGAFGGRSAVSHLGRPFEYRRPFESEHRADRPASSAEIRAFFRPRR